MLLFSPGDPRTLTDWRIFDGIHGAVAIGSEFLKRELSRERLNTINIRTVLEFYV